MKANQYNVVNSVFVSGAALLAASTSWAAAPEILTPSGPVDSRYFSIQGMHVEAGEIEVLSPVIPDNSLGAMMGLQGLPGGIVGPHATPTTTPALPVKPANGGGTSLKPDDGTMQAVQEVVNYGKQAWDFIVKNQPVVNLATDSANALPAGTSNWMQLQGWQTPVARTYHVWYTNPWPFNMTTVDFTYRVVYTYGGSMNNQGHYLTYVTVEPANIHVLWGYNFDADVKIPSVTNVSPNAETPAIAAALLRLHWKVHTYVGHDENTADYYMRGDGGFTDLNATAAAAN